MAEFCKECFLAFPMLETQEQEAYEKGEYILEESDYDDFCEGCCKWKPVVIEAHYKNERKGEK